MTHSDAETVLRNWIAQATSPEGRLPDGVDPAAWVAEQFTAWWRGAVNQPLSDAEAAAARLREDLVGFAYPELAEPLHELTHVQDALAELRAKLGLSDGIGEGT